MYQLMRNIHLGLGLAFVVMVLIFAVSSLVIAYRPWLPQGRVDSEFVVQVDVEKATSPRALAHDLMLREGMKGDLRQVSEDAGVMKLRIFRPGSEYNVEYTAGDAEAKVAMKRWGWQEMMVQLHVNHGFWHEWMPANWWAGLSLLASVGLLVLGATGLVLWFENYAERRIGAVLLALGLVWGIGSLVLTRMQM